VTYTGLTANVEYDLKMTYVASTSLDLYLDGALVATTTLTGSIDTNANPLTIGGDADADNAWFAGGITDVRIGDTSTSSPTWKLDMDFEPLEIYQTQPGTFANSWLFTGTVADDSASSNDGVYYITRDLSDLTVTVGGLTLDASSPPDPVVQDPPDMIGDTPIDIFLTPQPTVTGPGSSLFVDPITDAAENSGMPETAWFILFSTLIVAPVTARGFKLFPSWAGAAALAGIIYAIIFFTFGQTVWFLAFTGVWFASVIAIHQYMKA
jgi:hypothetical protein